MHLCVLMYCVTVYVYICISVVCRCFCKCVPYCITVCVREYPVLVYTGV